MNVQDYVSGKWLKQYQYKSFSPVPINVEWTWNDARINTLLEQANRSLGELNAYSRMIPNVDLFIRMHVIKEANTSSRIEGTQTEIDEAIRPAELVVPERRDDWQEVQNYVEAMNQALDRLEKLPLSNRLLKDTHEILMQGVRGEHKLPGQFRTSQNWIGGSGPSDAAFVPPHHDELPNLMSDLESFLHNDQINVPDLIRIAIAHYQFETIHPFCDGNGRIGRLLITLFLCSKGILEKPTLYLSAHLEKLKGQYYDALTVVRHSNDLGHWIRFFLNAIYATAEKGRQTFEEILQLTNEVEAATLTLGKRAENARTLLNHLYQRPLVTPNEAADLLDTSHQTASTLIRDFERLKILTPTVKIERSQGYLFDRYLRLFAS
jgi:Fic family protein